MKFLLAILFIAAATPAAADPASAIITYFGVTNALTASLIRIGVGLVVNAAAQMFARQKAKGTSSGIRTEVTTEGGTLPQTLLLGRFATSGNLVAPPYAHGESGEVQNAVRSYVIDIADVPVTAFNAFWVNGRKFSLPSDMDGGLTARGLLTPDAATRTNYVGYLRAKFFDGTQASAESYLTNLYGSHPKRPWSSDMIGRGVAYAIMSVTYNPDLYQGEPSFLFEVNGAKLYDWRKDSTAGGSGAHRWNNQATWEFTENPVVMAYNIFRGIPLPDGETWGLGVIAADLPTSWWTPAANRCDDTVGGAARYRAGYEVRMATPEQGGDNPLDVIDLLMDACDGEVADVGGVWRVRSGGASLPSVSITDDDIYMTSPESDTLVPPVGERINAIRASFPDPRQRWATREAPPKYDATGAAEDGQVLVAELALPAVWSEAQVERICAASLRDARRLRRHIFTLPPRFSSLAPLDTISWTSAERGYTSKVFDVKQVEIDPQTLSVNVSVQERNPGDYDFVAGDTVAGAAPTDDLIDYPPQALPGFTVTSGAIKDAAGADRRPFIQLNWNATAAHERILYEVRVQATAEPVVEASTSNVERGRIRIRTGILAATGYEARARGLRPRGGWTAWEAVTTPAVRLKDEDIDQSSRDAADARAAAIAGLAIAPVQNDLELIRPFNRQVQRMVATITDVLTDVQTRVRDAQSRLTGAGILIDPNTGQVEVYANRYAEEQATLLSLRMDTLTAEVTLRATQAWVNEQISLAVLDPTQIPLIEDLQVQINDVSIALDAANAEISSRALAVDLAGVEGRVTTAETDISALEGEIADRVTTAEFDAAETRLTTAENTLSTIDGASAGRWVAQARRQTRDEVSGRLGTLADLLNAWRDRALIRADLASVHEQLQATITADNEAIATLVTQIAARLDTSEARIVTEEVARATADSAQASVTTTLTSRVGAAEATIQTTTETVDGISAQYAVKVNVDGQISGISLISDLIAGNPASAFVVQADQFALAAPGSTAGYPFVFYTTPTVVNGATRLGLYINDVAIAPQSVGTPQVKDNSIMKRYTMTDGNAIVSSTSRAIIINAFGGDVENNADRPVVCRVSGRHQFVNTGFAEDAYIAIAVETRVLGVWQDAAVFTVLARQGDPDVSFDLSNQTAIVTGDNWRVRAYRSGTTGLRGNAELSFLYAEISQSLK